MKGKVKWFDRKKGYGFIEGEDGKDYFVHFTAVPKGVFLRENDQVSFEPGESERGKQARNVVLEVKASETGETSKDSSDEEESYKEEEEESEEDY